LSNKKVNRTLFGFAAVVILMLAVFVSLRFMAVQTLLLNKYLDKIEKRYEGRISIGKVLIRWPNRLEFNDLLILDPLEDTLLYASALVASGVHYNVDRNHLRINRIFLENPMAHLQEMPSGRFNHQILFDAFASNDSTKGGSLFSVSFNQLTLRKGAFSYRTYGALPKPGKVNWDEIDVTELETQVNRFELDSTGIRATIVHLGLAEQCGFRINDFSTGFEYDSAGIHTSQLELLTGNSRVVSASAGISIPGKAVRDSSGLFMDVVLGMDTYLSPVDINLIGGLDNELAEPIEISGVFKGNLRKAELSAARLNWGNLVYFEGDLTYEYPGLLKEAYFDLGTRNLMLNLTELTEQVFSGQVPGFELEVPEAVKEIGRIEYSGLFRGSLDNFITTGEWVLPYGTFSTDLIVNKNRPLVGYNFRGKVSAGKFNPDQWIEGANMISEIDFLLDVDGVWDGKKSVNAWVNGSIQQFTLNSYTFHNLDIDGSVNGKTFQGTLSLRDPNVRLDLTGKLNLGSETPKLDIDLKVEEANLNALALIRNDTASSISLNLHGELSGRGLDDLTGTINMVNSSYTNSRGTINMDELVLVSKQEAGQRQIILYSDFIDARLAGKIHMDDLPAQIQSLVARFIPALTNLKPVQADHLNDFAFNVNLKNPTPVARIFLPGFQCKDNTRFSGSYDASDQQVYVEGVSPQFAIGGSQYTGFTLKIQSRGDSVILSGDLEKVQLDRNNQFEGVNLDLVLTPNRLDTRLNWKNLKGQRNEGNIICQGQLFQDPRSKLAGSFAFPAAEFYFNDSLWKINAFAVGLSKERLEVTDLEVRHNQELVRIGGAISELPSDTLFLGFNGLNLNHLNSRNDEGKMTLKGFLSGNIRFYDMRRKGMFLADLEIDSLGFNGQMLGKTTIISKSQGTGEPVEMNVVARRGAINTLDIKGKYNPVSDSLDFAINLDKLRMDIANPWVNPELRDVKGIATGKVTITGKRNAPELNGNIMVQKGSFVVDYINTRFYFTHAIKITPGAFSMDQMDMQDDEGNHATVTGGIYHDNFHRIRLDLALDYQNFVLLNAEESQNDGYWGRAYATGIGTVRGPLRNLDIDVSATTSPKTRFFVPVNTEGDAREIDFIVYAERPKEETEPDLVDFTLEAKRGYEVNLHGATVNIDLAVTPDAEVRIIFDSKVGDVLRAQGTGNIRIYVNPSSRWTIFGDYSIESGDYQFTPQGLPVKKLQIEPGGTIKWTHDIPSAQLDIDAVYRTKATLYDLLQDESNPDLTQRIPVECHLMMSGYLENPVLDYNIVIPPTSNDIARSQLANLTEEEKMKQVISLLFMSRFTPVQGSSTGTTKGYASAGLATTTEVLSNQLNYWLSQISTDFDIGFNYRPGDELTSDEVEVALSKPFLNNRITLNVNGNYDVRQTTGNASQLVGDVEVEYKIKPSGKIRLKAFTRANDHLLYEYAPYTQGVGVFFREEFDSFGELIRRYRDKISGKER